MAPVPAPAASVERTPAPADPQLELGATLREAPRDARRRGAGDFVSPFEDELDVPTFIRRGGQPDTDDQAEEPAFLRRSAD